MTLSIEGEMTIYRAVELKRELLAALARDSVLQLDLSRVNELDSAGVQLLFVAKQAAQASNKEMHLVAHSEVVREIFALLNLSGTFGAVPSEISSVQT